jgi:hypothetical protein
VHDAYLFGAVDNLNEFFLERSTADQEAVDIRLRIKLVTVSSGGRATVDDASSISNLRGDVLCEPVTDLGVSLLCLSGGRSHTRTNCPDRLISDDNFSPVSLREGVLKRGKLLRTYIHGSAILAISELVTFTILESASWIKSF